MTTRAPGWEFASGRRAGMVRILICALESAVVAAAMAGCSLVSIKSPEKPLSARDLNTRILTHEYSAHFISAIEETADDIAASSADSEVRRNTLRWKIAATSASERAASQIVPIMALLDTWALSVQMQAYLEQGNGRALFGAGQAKAVRLGTSLSQEAQALASRVMSTAELARNQQLIDRYASAHPLESLVFARTSAVDLWITDNGAQTPLVDSLGTVPKALAETDELVRTYSDLAPSQMLWQAQLAALDSGLSTKEFQSGLDQLNARIERLAAFGETSPGLINGVVRDVQTRFDASWAEMLGTVRSESRTLSTSLDAQRQATVESLDSERAAIAADATHIADQVIREAGEQARRLIREAMLLAIAVLIVGLGMPFAAGYLLGRARSGR
jgi:hypothetical protein